MTYIHTQPWAFYNEIDEYAADWLENLIRYGVIAPGVVDRRSIEDVRPDDLRGFRQVHFFAGIGVWSYSLRCAGFSDDVALWTGSCPCQPFSAAGKATGMDDERHLWPALYHLIRECRPGRFYGEQVASSDGLGWLDLVQTDLEEARYAIGSVDTCSAGSGAPHIRQRLRIAAYDLRPAAGGLQHASRDGRFEWRSQSGERGSVGGCSTDGLGDSGSSGWLSGSLGRVHCGEEGARSRNGESERSGSIDGLDDDDDAGLEGLRDGHRPATGQREGPLRPVATASGIEWVADAHIIDGNGARLGASDERREFGRPEILQGFEDIIGLADADGWDTRAERQQRSWEQRQQQEEGFGRYRSAPNRPGPTNGFWRDADWLFCRDGKWRPISASPQSMADGSSGGVGFGSTSFPLIDGKAFKDGSGHPIYEGKSRQGMLKGYGNAIDAEATIQFLETCLAWERHHAADVLMAEDFADVFG